MKKLNTFLIALFIIGLGSTASAQKKSPPKTVEENVGSTKVVVKYHAPSVRDRVIFGGLEPWGKVWRAGANEATTIEFSTDVSINGQKLAAGTYAFFITPMEKGEWQLIFNKEAKQWGAYKYEKSKDALVIKVNPKKVEHVEQLAYGVEKNMVYMTWAKTKISFKVETLFEKE